MNEVRNRVGRAAMDGISDFPICPCSLRRLALTAVRASGSIRLSQRRKRRHPWRAQRGPSLARYALLQAYAPIALTMLAVCLENLNCAQSYKRGL